MRCPRASEEVEEAENEGIKILYLTSPVEFQGEGKVRRVKLCEDDSERRMLPEGGRPAAGREQRV